MHRDRSNLFDRDDVYCAPVPTERTHTWRKQLHVITSGEIGEQSFGYTGLIFFAHEYLCQILKK